ncbi:MAG: hypothetical protein GTO41_05800, partial [Burkholderiales bacterium]|nr:hypothetical protein [Burkholderiales bacterium]
ELEADDSGFLMASLAGFQTGALIEDPSQDFFSHWVAQTQSYNDSLHVSPQERSEFLRIRLKNILAKKDYF